MFVSFFFVILRKFSFFSSQSCFVCVENGMELGGGGGGARGSRKNKEWLKKKCFFNEGLNFYFIFQVERVHLACGFAPSRFCARDMEFDRIIASDVFLDAVFPQLVFFFFFFLSRSRGLECATPLAKKNRYMFVSPSLRGRWAEEKSRRFTTTCLLSGRTTCLKKHRKRAHRYLGRLGKEGRKIDVRAIALLNRGAPRYLARSHQQRRARILRHVQQAAGLKVLL